MDNRPLFLALLLIAALLLPACTPRAADCTQPEVFCVGLVTEVGKIDDRATNQAAWEGVTQARDQGIADWIASIETVDSRDYEVNIHVFAQAGYDVIVTVGSAMGEATSLAAADFPDIYFIGVNQYLEWALDSDTTNDLPNYAGLTFPEDQAGFLAGAMAALMTETRQVGAVCGSDAISAMRRYCEAYRAGTAFIDPSVVVAVIYHNEVSPDESLTDPDWGSETANSLIDGASDVIFGVGGSTGSNAILSAAMRGVYGIGMDHDQYYTLPEAAPRILTSVLPLISAALVPLIDLARGAQQETSIFPGGNTTGEVGLAPFHDLEPVIPEEVKTRLSDIQQALLSGDLQTGVEMPSP